MIPPPRPKATEKFGPWPRVEILDLNPGDYEVLAAGPVAPPLPTRRPSLLSQLGRAAYRFLKAVYSALVDASAWLLKWALYCWLICCLWNWCVDKGSEAFGQIIMAVIQLFIYLASALHEI